MKKPHILILSLVLGFCLVAAIYFGTGSSQPYSTDNPESAMLPSLFARKSGQPFTVTDPQNRGMAVVTFQLPEGWKGNSEVNWNMQAANNPASVYVRMQSADSESSVEIFPNLGFFWLDIPNPTQYLHAGQNYNGQIMARVTPPADALIQYVVKPLRGRQSQFRIVESRPMPGLARDLKVPGAEQIQGVMVSVTYLDPSGPVKEEFYALYGHQPVSTAIGVQHNWFLFSIYSLRGAGNRLDSERDELQSMLVNRTENPEWGKVYQQTMAALAQQFNQQMDQGYANIRAAGQMSQNISRNNDAMIQNMQQQRASTWSPSSGYSERAANSFDNYIKDEETYQDPYSGTSQQSSNYDYIWTDGYGNYRPSNDASYNPNIGGNQNWSLMKKKN